MKSFLAVSLAPHMTGPFSTRRIMIDVLIALVPALAFGVWVFGFNVLYLTLASVAAAIITEFLLQKYLFKQAITVMDCSAAVTGVLVAFNVPSSLPVWMVVLGSVFAVGIAKACYGGLGHNPFNPALIGRVFLLTSFPVAMTTWPVPFSWMQSLDGVTGATPLAIVKEGLKGGSSLEQVMLQVPGFMDLLFGFRGGCIGEVSILALFLGFVYLLLRRIITWHIPVIIVVSMFLFYSLFYFLNPGSTPQPFFHILTGGLFLGAIFMATDYTTSPMTAKGMIVYAAAIGILTGLIRVFGSYPEGMSFAILILNAFVPLIDKSFKPYRFGEGR